MRSNGDAAKDPRELEREVDEQRREIGETIHALEDKFSSREIYDQAAGYVREHGREFAESFGNSLKANPLPAVLTGIGLLWMMAGQRTPTQAATTSESRAGNLKQKGAQLKDKASSASQRAAATGQGIRERASSTGHDLRDRARGAREGISHSMDSARSNFDYYVREQPLALGAIGIALGAMAGASLPRTQAEQQTLGGIGERAKNTASQMAEKGYQKASEMGESVSREAQNTLDPQRHSEQQRPTSTTPGSQGPNPTT